VCAAKVSVGPSVRERSFPPQRRKIRGSGSLGSHSNSTTDRSYTWRTRRNVDGTPPSSYRASDSRPPAVVGVDDDTSWVRLAQALPGTAEATTTTLLAALWPQRHFVFDWRVHAAANGLRVAAGLSPTPRVDPDSTTSTSQTFEAYTIVRDRVVATASTTETPVAAVEPALYRLSQGVPGADTQTWRDYGAALTSLLG
jgi:hypothetical protein